MERNTDIKNWNKWKDCRYVVIVTDTKSNCINRKPQERDITVLTDWEVPLG